MKRTRAAKPANDLRALPGDVYRAACSNLISARLCHLARLPKLGVGEQTGPCSMRRPIHPTRSSPSDILANLLTLAEKKRPEPGRTGTRSDLSRKSSVEPCTPEEAIASPLQDRKYASLLRASRPCHWDSQGRTDSFAKPATILTARLARAGL